MAVRKAGLGKGLDSLIPEHSVRRKAEKTEQKPEKNELLLKITDIEPNREQPRKHFDEDALLELSDSIKQFGIIQPLIVQKKEDHYEIIAGERRWRAAKMAGLKEVPAIIKSYTDREILEISLIENIQRENLNPIDEARAYKKLLTEFHLKQDEVAERVSKSRTAVTNSMRLLKLDERVQQMVIDEMLTTGHARALISIEDRDLQFQMANQIFDNKLSVRETEKLVRKLGEEKEETTKTKEPDVEIIYRNLEEKVKEILGTKVQISHKKNNSGKIEIEYYSNEELERIMDLLESIEDEILNTLEEDMIQFEKENSISQLMNSIIFYISEHKQLVRLLFSDHGDPGFQNKLLLATQHWTMPMWQSRRPDYDAEALSSLHIYIVSGCMAVIQQWITGGFKESEEEISSMLEKLSASTSAGFLQGK